MTLELYLSWANYIIACACRLFKAFNQLHVCISLLVLAMQCSGPLPSSWGFLWLRLVDLSRNHLTGEKAFRVW